MFLCFASMEAGCLGESSFSQVEREEDRLEWVEEWMEAEEEKAG